MPGEGSRWSASTTPPAAVELTRALLSAQGLAAEVVQADVLTYQPNKPFDAIYEQTCLCALHPDHCVDYARQLRQWLKPQGSLRALFMQMLIPESSSEGLIAGPPYHCDINAMRSLFPTQDRVWPRPPYEKVPHPNGAHEFGLHLMFRQGR